MKYAFCLPAYKGKYLKVSLDSIVNQTYEDFELIVLDDCSPDNLREIVDQYDDPRVKYCRNEHNMGRNELVACWNKVISMTEADYVVLASDDDVYSTEFLREIDTLVELYPNCDLFRARTDSIDANGSVLAQEIIHDQYIPFSDYARLQYQDGMIMCIANFVFRRSTLISMGGFVSLPSAWFSDNATSIAMAKNGVVNTEKVLLSYRQSPECISYGYRKNREMAFKKSEATFLYDLWYKENVLECLEKSCGDIQLIRDTHSIRMLFNLNQYINDCSLKSFLVLLFRYVPGLNGKLRRLYSYLRANVC